ncbi:MAG TPA: efflux RND transporter periplasmic adaptor subunit [Blastocatellia bacterium]|nr:efflux RND transporter periplasmic adaptor subunit [Blastocatellia bacterium]
MKYPTARVTLAVIAPILFAAMSVSCGRRQETATVKASITRVTIEKVASGPVDDFYEATGTVRSKTTSVLSSKTLGNVLAIHVHEGDRVRAGQTLIEIDCRDAAAQLQRARAGVRETENALDEADRNIRAAQAAKTASEASLALAASTHVRYQKLLDRRSVSPQEFDEVQTKYKVAQAEAERATRMLASLDARRNQALAKIDQARSDVSSAQVFASYARVTSPINGIVTAKQIDTGMMATPGAPLLTVEDDSHYRLEASVEESQLSRITIGDPVGIQIDAAANEEISGRVAEIVPAADPASRSYAVKIDLPQQQNLRSGLYGKARFSRDPKQAITIPTTAIIHRGQLTGVFVVDDAGIVHMRLIATGKSNGKRIEVLGGLSDGERIVVDRVDALSDGNRVEP